MDQLLKTIKSVNNNNQIVRLLDVFYGYLVQVKDNNSDKTLYESDSIEDYGVASTLFDSKIKEMDKYQ